MNGNGKDYGNEELIALLRREFMIKETAWDCDRLAWARASIQVYDSVEDFWQQTGWKRDNPECCTEEYLTGNRICRWVDGKLVYFSRLVWEARERMAGAEKSLAYEANFEYTKDNRQTVGTGGNY